MSIKFIQLTVKSVASFAKNRKSPATLVSPDEGVKSEPTQRGQQEWWNTVTMTNTNKPESSSKKWTWVVIAGFLTAAILGFDFITKAIGVAEKILDICCGEGPAIPTVAVKPVDANWGGQCLEFSFEKLPLDFALSKIRLDVKSAKGPSPTGGNQSANILEHDVHDELPTSVFINRKPIEFDVRVQAEKENDALYVNYCPTLNRPGFQGSLTVIPQFLTPAGNLIKGLVIVFPEPQTNSVTFNVSRPRNLVPRVVTDQVRPNP